MYSLSLQDFRNLDKIVITAVGTGTHPDLVDFHFAQFRNGNHPVRHMGLSHQRLQGGQIDLHHFIVIKALAGFFGVTLDSFCRDDIDELQYAYQNTGINLSPAEHQLIVNYRSLNPDGQERLLDYADDLVQSGKYKKSGFTHMVEENA